MMILLLILSLTCTTGGEGGTVPSESGMASVTPTTTVPTVCPLQKAKENFDMSKFLGEWYVLEYVYDKPKKMKAFGCIGLDFSMTDSGELKSNFTFKFPAKTGFFYHVPSYSPVNTILPAIWDSKHRGEELTSLILDTDYNQWAVLAQCKKSSNALAPSFLSTRILSRSRVLSPEHLQAASNVVKMANPAADFQYPVDQTSCEPRKKKTQISAIIKKMRAMRKNWTTTPPTADSSNKKTRISALIQRMREMRKKWTTPKPLTTEKLVPMIQESFISITPSTQALKRSPLSSHRVDIPINSSWRFNSNNVLYILLLHICTFLNAC